MGMGISIFLIAVGAVVAFAVPGTTTGVNLDAVGLILVVVGAIGLIVSLIAATTRRGEMRSIIREDHHSHHGTH